MVLPIGGPAPGAETLLHPELFPHNQQVSLDVFTASDVESIAGTNPYETAYLLDLLNSLPGSYRGDWYESMLAGGGVDPLRYAGRLAGRYEAFRDKPGFWEWDWSFDGGTFWSMLGNLGGFAIGLALGGLVGYGATWAGAAVGGAVGGFWGSVAQLAVTAGIAYGSAELGEWVLTDDYSEAMSPFGEWLMSGAYVGGILGGAYYVYSQIPNVTAEFGLGYSEGWFDDLTRKGADLAFGTYEAITGIPLPSVVSAQTTTHWWFRSSWSIREGWQALPLVVEGQQ